MKKNLFLTIISASTLVLGSCSKDFLNHEAQSFISPDQLGKSPSGTQGTIGGIYAALRSSGLNGGGGHEDFGHRATLLATDYMGNDLVMKKLSWFGFHYDFSANAATSSRPRVLWTLYYSQIKNTNTLINAIQPNTTDPTLKAIRGQALALRGYFNFMLARLFGPTYVGNTSAPCIALDTTSETASRNTVAQVYEYIEKDLLTAIEALEGYDRGSSVESVNKQVAQAFLAEVYLEMGQYTQAAQYAELARQGYSLLSEENYTKGFCDLNTLKAEVMWGADITAETKTNFVSFFSQFDNTGRGYAGTEDGNVAIDKRLYESISDTDYRKKLFFGPNGGTFNKKQFGSYVSLKFRDPVGKFEGDYVYLRSSALYYIEAEAWARTGNNVKAQEVLFEITSARDHAYVQSTKTGNELIEEILLQKRIELWGEGYDFFDLKRLGKDVVRKYPNSNHGDFGKKNVESKNLPLAIPQREIETNPII